MPLAKSVKVVKINTKVINDISGFFFGRLKALKQLGSSKDKHIVWECICSCGNVINCTAHSLKRGNTKSCGCLHRETASQTAKNILSKVAKNHYHVDTKTLFLNKMFLNYKHGAKRRNYIFDLSKKDLERMAQGNCYLCGNPPLRLYKNKFGEFLYNGVDRINNLLGYTLENCKPCCWQCNKIKGKMSLSEFKDFIDNSFYNLGLG